MLGLPARPRALVCRDDRVADIAAVSSNENQTQPPQHTENTMVFTSHVVEQSYLVGSEMAAPPTRPSLSAWRSRTVWVENERVFLAIFFMSLPRWMLIF